MHFHQIGIVGGGIRGKSLARLIAQAGLEVLLLEVSKERAEQAKQELALLLDEELAKWGITASEKSAILKRVQCVSDQNLLSSVDLLAECIPEQLEAKQQVLAEMNAVCKKDCVFISNTSTLSISEIAAASGRPAHVVGMQFLSPVTQAAMVEVVRCLDTTDAAFALALELARLLGKEPIEVFDSPGSVACRAMMPFLNEAMHLVMESVASAESVDKAIRLGYDFRIGPLEYADRVGLDKIMLQMEHLFHEFGDPKFRPCPLLRRLVRAGHYGRRTGQGFFRYDEHGKRL